jgi:hypothetical protein
MGAARTDPRGHVAIVYACPEGPDVHFVNRWFLPPRERLLACLCSALGVYAESDGTERGSFPRAAWVQTRAGHWEPALRS